MNKEKKDNSAQNVVKIYEGLSEVKRSIWIGNGNLLLASQLAEAKRHHSNAEAANQQEEQEVTI